MSTAGGVAGALGGEKNVYRGEKCQLAFASGITHHEAWFDLPVALGGGVAFDEAQQQAHAFLAEELALRIDGG